MEEEEKKQHPKFQVVVLSTPEPEPVAQVVSQRIGRPLEDCLRLVKTAPVVVAANMDGLYADDMVGMIKSLGGDAEKRVIPSSLNCPIHKDQSGRAFCQICNKIICALCIRAADGNPICPECSGETRKIETKFPWVRLVILLSLIGAGVYAYLSLTKEREPWAWDRPFKLAVIGVFEEFQGAKSMDYVANFFQDTGQDYYDLRNHTLYDMTGWFQKEYERYGGALNPAVELTILKPIKVMEIPPKPPPLDMKFIDRFFDYRKFKYYFRDVADKKERDLTGYDGVIWVHFVENGEFEGFTESWSARHDNMSVVKCYIDPNGVDTNIMVILHEFAHLVEAEDHYDPSTGLPLNPEGLVEPFLEEVYPQDYGELMAGKIPSSASEASVARTLRNLRIGLYTAHEFGWVSDEQMQSYIDSGTMPEMD